MPEFSPEKGNRPSLELPAAGIETRRERVLTVSAFSTSAAETGLRGGRECAVKTPAPEQPSLHPLTEARRQAQEAGHKPGDIWGVCLWFPFTTSFLCLQGRPSPLGHSR